MGLPKPYTEETWSVPYFPSISFVTSWTPCPRGLLTEIIVRSREVFPPRIERGQLNGHPVSFDPVSSSRRRQSIATGADSESLPL